MQRNNRRTICSPVGVVSVAQKAEKCVDKALGLLVELNLVPRSLHEEKIANLRSKLREIKSDSDGRVVIALAGKFSSGKSSFINSLIGEEVAPVQAERTTRCKTVFTGNPKESTKIEIVDGGGNSCTLKQYRERSATASKRLAQYTVYVPKPDWRSIAIVDTPGFDPVETADSKISDDAISRLAVKESNVVFFVIEMNAGTIANDSMKYLKEISQLGRQKIYIIINKADSKSPSARQRIMDSLKSECQRNGIRYDGILPYSSLLPKSSVILAKPDAVRPNVLELIEGMRRELLSVIDRLSGQCQNILMKKKKAEDAVALSSIDGIIVNTRKLVLKAIRTVASGLANLEDGQEGILSDITSLLVEQAAACMSRNALEMINVEELPPTGLGLWPFIWHHWKVSLVKPSDRVCKLSASDRNSLTTAIDLCLESVPWEGVKVAEECVSVLELVSMGIISSYCGTSDFEAQVGSPSEWGRARETIREKLDKQFPDDFLKECRKRIQPVLESAKKKAEIAEKKKLGNLKKIARELASLKRELQKVKE